MQGQWPNEFKDSDPSIQYLELFAQTAGFLAWSDKLANKQVLIYCDNSSVVTMINNTTSSCKNCMVLIRILVYHCLTLNIKLMARHVKTHLNGIADSLSRFQMRRFHELTKGLDLDAKASEIPDSIWPPTKIWLS